MLARSLALFLMLSLLTQAFAPAWASAAGAKQTTADQTVDARASMPCHSPSEDAAAAMPVASAPASMDCCGDGGDCGHCTTGCMSTPGLPADTTMSATPATPCRYTQHLRTARLSGPPQELLRPPIA